MSIASLPYNPVVLADITTSDKPTPAFQYIVGFVQKQNIAQSDFNIGITNVNCTVVEFKKYLINIVYSLTASINTTQSLVVQDNIVQTLAINLPATTNNQVYTSTFEYTASVTGPLTFTLSTNVTADKFLITTTSDIVNVIVFAL